MDFIAKLVALVPRPRVNLTRCHGVLAPNSKNRINATPAQCGKGRTNKSDSMCLPDQPSKSKRREMAWGQRFKRVFNIDVTVCKRCGGAVKIIACIEDPVVVKKILDYVDARGGDNASTV